MTTDLFDKVSVSRKLENTKMTKKIYNLLISVLFKQKLNFSTAVKCLSCDVLFKNNDFYTIVNLFAKMKLRH